MKKFLAKVPWGVVAGACGIMCFYCTVGVIVAQFVLAQVSGQTGQTATIFDNWWQIILFVGLIVTALAFLGALTLFIMKKLRNKRGGADVEKVA